MTPDSGILPANRADFSLPTAPVRPAPSRSAPTAAARPAPAGRAAGAGTAAGVLSASPLVAWWEEQRKSLITTSISFSIHLLVLGVLSLMVFRVEGLEEVFTTIVGDEKPTIDDTSISESSIVQPEEISTEVDNDSLLNETVSTVVSDQISAIELDISDADPSQIVEDISAPGLDIKIGSEMAGRTAVAKAALVRQLGGNSASEASVVSGLKWLKKRQLEDGSWSFDHTVCEDCKGKDCSQAGTFKEYRTGATGLALMAFLGGGHTHEKGDYKKEVRRGLDALIKMGKAVPAGFDLRGGPAAEGHNESGMYAHAIATIALCEALALTKDNKYRQPALGAIKFIMAAQDPKGGGWRYQPQQAGDTSVVGWQIMALKSAKNANLKIPGLPQALKGAELFLTSMQLENGAQYRYDPTVGASPTCTAIGLLCRMYLGWNHDKPALAAGVKYLDDTKPATNNMYYNYYATQVMLHWGGEEWTRWNNGMREHLVRTQLKDGPEAGSWDLADPHGGAGGRLYMTTLAVMTLEVYYRHLPIYQRESVKVEF